MLRRHAQLRTLLFFAADAAATAAALAGAYLLRFESGLVPVRKIDWDPARYADVLPTALLLCLAAYTLIGTYRPRDVAESRPSDPRSAAAGAIAGALVLAAAALFYRDPEVVLDRASRYQYSRGLLAIFPFAAAPALWAGRRVAEAALTAVRRRGIGLSRAVLAGSGAVAERLERAIAERPWLGIRIAGRVEEPEEIPAALREHRAEQVFLAFPGGRSGDLVRATEILSGEMADVRVVPDVRMPATVNPEVALLSGLPVVTLAQTPFYGLNRIAKRVFDVAAGTALLVLLLPLLLLTGLLVLVFSGRPVFYSQERMGLDGRRFRILKFRTMRPGAEADGARWATSGDPRCTRVGTFLRRFSLDELPQLVNVLRGDMSLVGPRPERPVFIESFRERLPGYMRRHRIPAGLTGLAQVRGFRGDTDLAGRLESDLDYLERWSILLDVEILLRTVWRVFRR